MSIYSAWFNKDKIMKKVLVVAILLLFVGACVTPDVILRQRSKSMHETVHQEYLNYVEEDDSLLPQQKEIRKTE